MTHVTDAPPAAYGPPAWSAPSAPPLPPAPPARPTGRRRWITRIAAGLIVLLVGLALGAGSRDDHHTELAVTHTELDSARYDLANTRSALAAANAKPPQIVTQAVTPPACASAIDLAEQIIGVGAESASDVGAYFGTVSTLANSTSSDISGIIEFLDGMTAASKTLSAATKANTAKLETINPSYRAAAAQCRAS